MLVEYEIVKGSVDFWDGSGNDFKNLNDYLNYHKERNILLQKYETLTIFTKLNKTSLGKIKKYLNECNGTEHQTTEILCYYNYSTRLYNLVIIDNYDPN